MLNENDLTVLICDDDQKVLETHQGLLEIQGYTVIISTNGKEALEIIKTRKIHILLLDYRMPELSGEDVVNEIRKHDQEMFIIINTGYSQDVPPLETMQRLNIQGYHNKNDGTARLLLDVSNGAAAWRQINELKRLFKLSTTDGLTDLYNRTYLFQLAEKEYSAMKRYKRDFSVMMIDIDFFKKFNDNYGHKTGDEVLKKVAHTLTQSVRQDVDIVGRYGGEEFAVVLPETDLEQAKVLGERLRSNVEQIALIKQLPELRVTVSVGIAQLSKDETLEDLFKRADNMLYRAKESGRNRVESWFLVII